MRFDTKLHKAIISLHTPDLMSEERFSEALLPEGTREYLDKIIQAVKNLLSLDAETLLSKAESIHEGLEELYAKTKFEGNSAKVVEVTITMENQTVKKYLVISLNYLDAQVEKTVRARLPANWNLHDRVPFNWYDTMDEAMQALEQKERKTADQNPLITKPSLKSTPKSASKAPVAAATAPVNANIIQIAELLAPKMKQVQALPELKKMNRTQFVQAMEAGKESVKLSDWAIIRNIALSYLAITALVTGTQGLAALVSTYLAIKGLEFLHKKGVEIRARRATMPEPTAKTQPLLNKPDPKHDPQDVWQKLYPGSQRVESKLRDLYK